MTNDQQILNDREMQILEVFSASVAEGLKKDFAEKADLSARKAAVYAVKANEDYRARSIELAEKNAYEATLKALQNYRLFQLAVDSAVYDAKTAQEDYDINGIFRDLLSQRDKEEVKLDGIKKSAIKTKWLVDNIRLSADMLEAYSYRMGDNMRINVQIMRKYYLDPIPLNGSAPLMKDIAEEMGVAPSSATERRDNAVRLLSKVLWGVATLGI